MSDALVAFTGDRFLARKKVFTFLGNAFHVYASGGELRFYVKQKAFKLKEAMTVFADEAQQQPMLTIKARSVLDFSGTYDVSTMSGERVGSLKRQGLKSMLRDSWDILSADDEKIGTIEEDSMLLALFRRLLSNLVPQSFTARVGGQKVAVFDQMFNPFVAKYDIDFSMDQSGVLDRRLGIAAVVLLLAIEGRQD